MSDIGEAAARAVTFMLTDVEGSTRLWEHDPTAMQVAMARHDALIARVVTARHGTVLRERGEGDSSFSVFEDTTDAVLAATDLQLALAAEAWPPGTPIRVRLAIHAGEAEHRDGDYYGSAVNRCARLRALAAGGQSVISTAVRSRVPGDLHGQVSFLDLGSHRLKDLAQPEHIYQLCAPGLPAEFPALRGLEALPNNLPTQLTSFVGREPEVSALTEALRGTRLLTLTGTGGCGKTRLALQVAAGLADSFEDGVWFVDLSSITDPVLVPAAVAGAVGVNERAGQAGDGSSSLADTLAAHLSQQRALLILDNCEHLVATCADLALALLGRTRHLVVLATSREVLNIPGEVAWRVPSLPVPNPLRLPELELLGAYDSVRLFTDRARLGDRDFRLTAQNCAAVAEICAQVDGIPLALELAAARVRVLHVDQIAARLGDQFRLLTSSSRSSRSRQATLRGAVDWSYELLEPGEAAMFRRLSIFSGGWSLEAAESVCGNPPEGEDTVDLLSRLLDKSLLVRDHQTSRYRLLEPLRQYAREKLVEEGEVEELRDRHLRWFVQLASRAGGDLTSGRQLETLAILDAELDNIRAALEWSISRRRPEALELAAPLRLYWLYRNLYSEGRAWLEEALDAAGAGSPGLRASALLGAGRLAVGMAQPTAARDLLDSALQVAESNNLTEQAVSATWYLGQVAMETGDYSGAATDLARAVAMARQTGNAYLMTVTLLDSARCRLTLGEDAAALVAEGIGLARQNGDIRNTSVGLCIRGRLEIVGGQADAATATLEEAAALGRSVGARVAIAEALVGLGELSLASGDLAGARQRLGEALLLCRETDDADVLAQCLEAIADFAVGANPGRAAVLVGAADALRTTGNIRAYLAPWKSQHLAGLLAALEDAEGPASVAAQQHRGRQLAPDLVLQEALAALV